MTLQQQVSLQPFNTFGIDAKADYFTAAHTLAEVIEALQWAQDHQQPVLILGGGSNILLTQDVKGLVLQVSLKGIERLAEDEDTVRLRVGAGELWHPFVLHCVAQNWGGIENLSLIPGTVGAAPIQNIGAYGVEIKEVLESVEVLDCQDFSLHTFSNVACAFGYRDSIFKQAAKGKYLITAATFVLQKKPTLHLTYGVIQQTLEAVGVTHPTIQDVSRAVCHIRSTKLPNPQEIGNAGSFFKNPEIDLVHYQQLKSVYSTMPSYAVANPAKVKVPAGWLIEQAGWKGVRQGNVGVHKDQALVLVNYGGAQGSEIVALASQVQAAVRAKFEIDLTPEINYI